MINDNELEINRLEDEGGPVVDNDEPETVAPDTALEHLLEAGELANRLLGTLDPMYN